MFSHYAELQVNECYFCQPWALTSTPSIPQCNEDGLFLLGPDEKPLCAADALLLFCIDISGSMSITSEVKITRPDTDLFTVGDHEAIF